MSHTLPAEVLVEDGEVDVVSEEKQLLEDRSILGLSYICIYIYTYTYTI